MLVRLIKYVCFCFLCAPFWAGAPNGTKSCRTQWDFRLSVCSFVHLFIFFVPPHIRPLRPQIWPLRPQIWPHRPQIQPLRPQIWPLRPQIRPLRPQIQPLRPRIQSFRPQTWPVRFQIMLLGSGPEGADDLCFHT